MSDDLIARLLSHHHMSQGDNLASLLATGREAAAELTSLRALVKVAADARLMIDTGFSEMGETVNYSPSLISKVCDMLEPHAALSAYEGAKE